jgi:uncharacterized membrane protein YphA (DoxX/SURF4 family)
VFVVSGALKFLYANQGPGRFAHLGLPWPGILSTFVGSVEISMGVLVAIGFLTRLAAIPLGVDMVVALAVTKLPLLAGVGPEIPPAPPRGGFWAFAYQARLDVTMLALCTYLVIAGAGAWSFDAWMAGRRSEHRSRSSPGQAAHTA